MPSVHRIAARALILCAAGASQALAQTTTPPDGAAPQRLPTVTVTGNAETAAGRLNLDQPNPTGSRMNLTPLELPATVQTITGETLRARGDRSVLDAVTRATGITALATPGNGNAALSERGFAGVNSVMQLYDGTQLYVGSGTVTFPFDPWTVERIDVLSGPASVLYGQGAIGGIVNVIPRRPDPLNPSTTGQVTIGSYDTFREAVDTTGPLGPDAAYRLDISHADSDGWVDRGRSTSTALSASLRFDPTPDLHITLSEDYGNQWPMQYFGTPLINGNLLTSLRDRNFNVGDSTIHWVDNWSQMKTEWTPVDGVAVHNDLYWLGTNRHWREAEGYIFQPTNGTIQRKSYIEVLHHETQYGDHGDVSLTGTIAGHRNDVVTGFDVNSIRFESVSNSPFGGTSTLAPFGFSPGGFINLTGTAPQFRAATEQYALFAEDRFKLTEALSLVGGLRHDQYDLGRTDLIAHSLADASLSNTSWRVGTVYEVIPDLALYAQYATAADPISSLITLTPAQQGFTLATGRQIEIGAKQSIWNGRAEWTVAGYDIVKNNILSAVPNNPALSQQVGAQASRGIELAASVALGGGWRITANGTLLQARFDNFSETVNGAAISRAGKIPPNVPERVANVWLDWALAPGWQAGAGLRYVGHRYADNADTLDLPGYTVVDAGVRWTPTDQWRVDLHIYNAFDTLYVAAPYNGGTQWILGEPLSVELTASLRF